MALVKINEHPKITDTILLEITTPDANGCFLSNPYRVDSVVVYYVERDFLSTNFGQYTENVVDPSLQSQLDAAVQAACLNPSDANMLAVTELQNKVNASARQKSFYYKDRVAVKVIGNDSFPAWLSTDPDNADLTLEATDADGNTQYGHFSYEWQPDGKIREGDYFICWTWTPLLAGSSLSSHLHFVVEGDSAAVSTTPAHQTPPDKYTTLTERYLPEIYKFNLMKTDLTPEVTDNLNKAVSQGFTFLENMANQIIDLFDANALHESLLAYLSNFFGLKLRSDDPTLWRRQIKEAISLFKKKGTLSGLEQAFAQAGMTLNKFTQYWQLVSPYTWTQSFLVGTSPVFDLEKNNIVLPPESPNFGLWIKRANATTYTALTSDYVTFATAADGTLQMTWIGDELSANGLSLFTGDHLKVKYQYSDIPDGTTQNLENYIQSLPLMDQRDENDQAYPPINWNVHLISEDDPLFSVLVPVRHPFEDPIIFGYLRTEFAYSENIYNMEEYNGSTRPSTNPCDIDKNFVDPCGACLSSSYSVDLSIEELSNDRLVEAQDVLREYLPFHARLHSISFAGEVNEFVSSPVETIQSLITIDHAQFVISGSVNPFFNRIMDEQTSNWMVTRDELTKELTVLSGKMGNAYNDHVSFVYPDLRLEGLGIIDAGNLLEILAPSANAGTYSLTDISGHEATVPDAVPEPVDESAFTFNLSNLLYHSSTATIDQADLFVLSDEGLSLANLGVKTEWDVLNTPDYTGGAWKVLIPAYSSTPYVVKDVIGGQLVLEGDTSLPTSSVANVSYTVQDDHGNAKATSATGTLTVTRRGYVNFNDPYQVTSEVLQPGDYLYYNGSEYLVTTIDGQNFWIEGYTAGNVGGANVQVRRRLVDQGVGYFGYSGLRLTTFADHEAEFGMINGSNPPPADQQTDDSHFKENFLFQIDGELYKIASINKNEVVLSGRYQDWKTKAAGGTTVAYSILWLQKQTVDIGFTVFDQLDRNGKDPVIREIFSTVDNNTAIVALSIPQSSGVQENVAQDEGITFAIETRNGEVSQGEI